MWFDPTDFGEIFGESCAHFIDIAVTVFWLEGHGFSDDTGELLSDAGMGCFGVCKLGCADGFEDGHWIAEIEGVPFAGHAIEHHTQGEQVCPVGAFFAFDLLGGHVGGAAHNGTCAGHAFAIEDACEAKVCELDGAVFLDEDVFGFEVPVDNLLFVCVGEGGSDLFDHGCGEFAERKFLFFEDIL